MTHFAPVGPLAVLREVSEETLGDYHLLIAPKVLANPDEYEAFFRRKDFVIVDNGVIELGYPLDIRDLYRAARIVRANVVVLPDTIDDAKMTVKQAVRNVDAYRRLDPHTSLMGVVQGTNFKECMECAEGLHNAGVDWFGVPRGLTPNLGSRIELVINLVQKYAKPIHVLGFSENIKDDVLTAIQPGVRGMDAATPLWYGLSPLWAILPPEPPTEAGYGRRPADWWERTTVGPIPWGSSFEAEHNVKTVRQWLTDARDARTRKAEHAAPPALWPPR